LEVDNVARDRVIFIGTGGATRGYKDIGEFAIVGNVQSFECSNRESADLSVDGGHNFFPEARRTGKGWVGFMNVADGDEIHFLKRTGVFFHVNAMLGEEGPDGLFDIVEETGGAKFESDNQPLVPFFSDDGVKGLIKFSLVFREFFDVDLFAGGVVKENVWCRADESRKEFLEEIRGVAKRFLDRELNTGLIAEESGSNAVGGCIESGCGSSGEERHGRRLYVRLSTGVSVANLIAVYDWTILGK
jgi:hypothetical protein